MVANLTWKLWSALKNPPFKHPLFMRSVNIPAPSLPRHIGFFAVAALLPIACLLAAVIPQAVTLIFFLPILFVVFNGNIYGLIWAIRISRSIAKEHESQTYETLSLMPQGALGATWAICTACIHRGHGFDRLQMISAEEFFIALLVSVTLSVEKVQYYAGQSNAMGLAQSLLILTYVVVLLVGFYVNHIQSVVLGGLIGMYIPHFVHSRLDAQFWTIGIYILTQITTYIMTWLVSAALLPTMARALNVASLYMEIVLAVLSLGVFYLIRELVILFLWRNLIFLLNSNVAEVESVVHFR